MITTSQSLHLPVIHNQLWLGRHISTGITENGN
jgi:hypothetical protein